MAKKKDPNAWEHSEAKKLLFQAVVDGNVSLDSGPGMWPRQVYLKFVDLPEFKVSDFGDKEKFGNRLRGVRLQVKERQERRVADRLAFDATRKKHPKQPYWNGSAAHKLLQSDMDANMHMKMKPSQLRDLPGRELYKTVSLEVFRKAIHSESYSRKKFKDYKKKEIAIIDVDHDGADDDGDNSSTNTQTLSE